MLKAVDGEALDYQNALLEKNSKTCLDNVQNDSSLVKLIVT